MASPHASSLSEGEIIEMKQDKASTAQSAMKNMSVDRKDRKLASTSTSRSSSYTPEAAWHRSRSRSRSPYRHRSPRGEKRRREDDYSRDQDRYESRRFRPSRDDSRSLRGYHDLNNPDSHSLRHDNRSGRKKHRNRDRWHRSRSRSRSPWSRRKENKRVRDDRPDDSNRRQSPQRDSTSQGNRETVNQIQKEIFGSKASRNLKATGSQSQLDSKASYTKTSSQVPNGLDLASMNAAQEEVKGHEPEMDEVAQIEARRKRREALKAKLRSQPTPLLAQVLHIANDSTPSTPAAGSSTPVISRSASPTLDSPKSQTAADSPAAFAVEDDTELANHNQFNEPLEGPSAADYDPTADMQEERARHDHRLHDLSASGYDETKETHEVLMPHPTFIEPGVKQKSNEYDMFADEDDDDMFAPEASKPKGNGSQKPKQLDAKLLDDWDDPDGYYRIIIGELLDGRYHVQASLGKGMFSAVVRALDRKSGKLVAIKIIRNNETMKKAGLKEIGILQSLAAADPDDKKHLIRLERSFEHKSHLCMVFENLSINLREVLKKFGRDVGINLRAVRTYAQQMFLGLKLFRSCEILHADLKPDNMLVNDARNILKICDLGSAGHASDSEITPYLVSRFYRAPEIILGMPFDYAIDTWSVGCTLFELYTGKILFIGRNNNQMLKAIMECRGKFSLKMLKKGHFAGDHFDENMMFKSRETDKITGKEVVRMLNFVKPTRDLKTRLLGAAKDLGESDLKELNMFVDFLDRCLALNPEKRISPTDALNHPFINRRKGQ